MSQAATPTTKDRQEVWRWLVLQRSIEKHGARYVKYYGDGDSKSFDEVKSVYPEITVEKCECIGHYQKRVGNRLRKLRARTKGLGGKNKKVPKKDVCGKSKVVKAKSRLTGSIIRQTPELFRFALRSNVGNVKNMQDAILACMFYVASSDSNNYHDYCPQNI